MFLCIDNFILMIKINIKIYFSQIEPFKQLIITINIDYFLDLFYK